MLDGYPSARSARAAPSPPAPSPLEPAHRRPLWRGASRHGALGDPHRRGNDARRWRPRSGRVLRRFAGGHDRSESARVERRPDVEASVYGRVGHTSLDLRPRQQWVVGPHRSDRCGDERRCLARSGADRRRPIVVERNFEPGGQRVAAWRHQVEPFAMRCERAQSASRAGRVARADGQHRRRGGWVEHGPTFIARRGDKIQPTETGRCDVAFEDTEFFACQR
jgi:hypothetical protein